MKKYIKEEWAFTNNPFKNNYKVLESPITKHLPVNEEDPKDNFEDEENQEPEELSDPGQEGMPGIDSPEDIDVEDPESTYDEEPSIDFETEKLDYMDLCIGRKNEQMMDKLLEMRDIKNLTSGQFKFIEDNMSILSLARDVEFADAQKKIYKQIKDKYKEFYKEEEENEEEERDLEEIPDVMEESFSALDVYSIFSKEIEQFPTIVDSLIKLPSFISNKADYFRKIIASSMNAVQVGSGGTLEDLFIPIEKDGKGIKICTRNYTDFGNIKIGKWELEYNDPENYLSDSEIEKLNNSGSPEEREIIQKRVIIEAISEEFKNKIYMILINDYDSGTRNEIGFDFSELLRDGWKNGYISVKFKANVGKGEAGIKIDGQMIDLQDIVISYIREDPSKFDEEGLPIRKPVTLLEQKEGFLYLVIDKENFESLVNKTQIGIFYQEKLFDSGPEQLKKIQRCVPDIKEILLKQC